MASDSSRCQAPMVLTMKFGVLNLLGILGMFGDMVLMSEDWMS